jgi:hypothetical protein
VSYKTVLQGSVFILIFAYIALGPYSSIYQQAIDQVKGPVEIAYRAASNAVYDIYLLATNPTEWYARQQVINTRPEKPLSFPKALEVSTVDAMPSSVPGGQPFVMTMVLKNEGDLPVTKVEVAASCNQWCQVPLPKVNKKFRICYDDTLRNSIWCAEDCETYAEAEDPSKAPIYTAKQCVDRCIAIQNDPVIKGVQLAVGSGSVITPGSPLHNQLTAAGAFVGSLFSDICISRDVNALGGIYYENPKLIRGDSEIVTVEPFISKTFAGHEAETRIAQVYLNVSFYHSTTSQLLVSVISEDEKNRSIRERTLEFKPVVATAKVSPAKLSLNVGPQPLLPSSGTEKKQATLLVSVSNDRDNSRIILDSSSKIYLTLPLDIGSNLKCPGTIINSDNYFYIDAEGKNVEGAISVNPPAGAVAERLIYTIQPTPPNDRVEILPFEFNTVYVFICKFDIKKSEDIATTKTGIITANLTSYKFVHTIKKDVPVTTPVGILFDPYENYCNSECGKGALNKCDADECHAISTNDPRNAGSTEFGKCYIEYATTDTCHSCARIQNASSLSARKHA